MKKLRCYKRILILLAILTIIFPSGITFAQEVNLALTGTPSHVFNSTSQSGCPDYFGYGKLIQFDSRLNDNSSANPAIGIVGYGPGTVGFDFTSQIDLTTPSTINRIEVDFRGIVRPGTEYLKAYIYRAGIWIEVGSIAPYSMYGNNMAYLYTYQFTTGAPWINVEKVRIKAYSYCCPTQFQACVEGVVFEIRAFGQPAPAYQDIGLRVWNGGPQPIAIAAEPTGTLTSPLRISKDGVTYGIALVDPGDPNDSGVRIQTSSGIKALRRYP